MNKLNNSKAMFALMLVLFIDGMGQGLIFPILNDTLLNPHVTVLLHTENANTRSIWYGVLIAVYFLMWFLSATILGDWSDNVGRKKALLVCLTLAAVGFLLSAFAFQTHSLWLLLFGRLLGGVTSGDQAIAQASVIDMCDPKKKSVYLGLVLLSVTLGLVVGPLIGGLLENSALVSWFSYTTPFYFATILAFINIVLLGVFYKETQVNLSPHQIQWTKSFTLFFQAFSYKHLRLLLSAYILGQTGWAMFYVYTANFITVKYYITPALSGWFLALIGAGLGVGLGLLPSLIRNQNPKYMGALGFASIIIPCLLFVFSNSLMPIWILIIPTTALLGLGYANILTLFSEAVDSSRQGWIMGVTGSVVALSAGIDSLLSGFLSAIQIEMPYLFSIILLSMGFLLLLFFKRKSV